MKPLTMETLYSNATGQLDSYADFASRYVPARRVEVWCPPGYAVSSAAARYPVLYMHDGQNIFLPTTAYGGIPWGVDEALVRLIDPPQFAGAIVVGIWNVGANRWGEYLPQKPAETQAGRAFAARFADRLPGAVYSDAYLKFLVEDLKPFIDRTYRTRPDQPNTFVMGSSMGGLISLYALTEYPHIFGGAGCLSTHWLAGEQLLTDYFGRVLSPPGAHRLYFDYGTETLDAGYEPFQLQMDNHLRAAGYTFSQDWLTLKFPGAEHSEKWWRARVHLPLSFLLTGTTAAVGVSGARAGCEQSDDPRVYPADAISTLNISRAGNL
jgi:predicted alpha/beta superfamily hydrolase